MKTKTAEETIKELQDFAIWMTGCGFDFAANEYYQSKKHLLTEKYAAQQFRPTLPSLSDEEIYIQAKMMRATMLKDIGYKGKFTDEKIEYYLALMAKMARNTINQSHVVGEGWVSVDEGLPEIPKDKNCSNNVFAWEDGKLFIMCLAWVKDDDNEWCKAWCRVYEGLGGDGEFDDQYNPTHWMKLPSSPTTK